MTTSAHDATNPSISASELPQQDGSSNIRMRNRSIFINSIYGKNKKENGYCTAKSGQYFGNHSCNVNGTIVPIP